MPGKVYWLDTNVFIVAANGPYRFSTAPGFWHFLDEQRKAGTIRVPQMVYNEIMANEAPEDDLAKWVKNRRATGFFVTANSSVQSVFKEVADHVVSQYQQHFAAEFLGGADPWLIAHAKESKGTVVTFENRQPEAQRVKIPNVCVELDVPFVSPYDMLERLKAEFTQKKKPSS